MAIALKVNQFRGILPRVFSRLLPENAAQTAQNCKLVSGRLVPLLDRGDAISFVRPAGAPPAACDTIYLHRRAGLADAWLGYDGDVDIVPGPINDDQYFRAYRNTTAGVLTMIYGSNATPSEREAKITKPTTAPTVTAVALWNPALSTATGLVSYKITVGGSSDTTKTCTTTTGTYTGHTVNADNSVTVRWNMPRVAAATESYKMGTGSITMECTQTLQLQLTGAGAVTVDIPPSGVGIIDGLTFTLPGIGTGTVRNVALGGWVVDYKYVQLGTRHSITPVVSDWILSVTLEIRYDRSNTENRYYLYTNVDDLGAESAPSPISSLLTLKPGFTVSVSIPVKVGTNTQKFRLYRSASGVETDNFFYVADVTPSGGATTYSDTVGDQSLGEVLSLIEDPPTEMYGLVSCANGFLAAFNDKELYFSEPFLPWSWPTEYRLTMDHDIIALCAVHDHLYVFTKGGIYLCAGSSPDVMTQTKISTTQTTVSKRGVCEADGTVYFPSPDGFCALRGANVQVITDAAYTKDEWALLTPANFIARVYDRRIMAWSTPASGLTYTAGTGLIIDLREPYNVTTCTLTSRSLFVDAVSDKLYLLQGPSIYQFEGAATNLTMVWKSKDFWLGSPWAPTTVRVVADSYPASPSQVNSLVIQSGDGDSGMTTQSTTTITSLAARRLAVARKERVWNMQITAAVPVSEIGMASGMEAFRS